MNVAFIPVRGGSKSIPLKNIKEMNGRPLVYWVMVSACLCHYIDRVYIATDSEKIRNTVERLINENSVLQKIRVISRGEETATDGASTESAMLEFANNYNFDNIVLIQATSPLLKKEDLDKGFEIFSQEDCDSVLSVVRQKRFLWMEKEKGLVEAANYDIFHRPRRQEFDGYYVENGAFYITSKDALLRTKNRISGNIKAVEMSEDTFWEIDEPEDWNIISLMLDKNRNCNRHKSDLKMLLTDCDGCLTDGGMYYSEKGDELKKFNTRDGVAIEQLKKLGVITGIITGEKVELNRRRAEKLSVDEYIGGCKNKLQAVQTLCEKYNINLENIVYIGDDINDSEVLSAVGVSCCPKDASMFIKNKVQYISQCSGGQGVLRDVAVTIWGIN